MGREGIVTGFRGEVNLQCEKQATFVCVKQKKTKDSKCD